MFIRNRWLVTLVWLSLLFLYGVHQVDRALQASRNSVQDVQFVNGPVPVTLNGSGTDNVVMVPMGNNTVWMIDRAGMTVSIITRDKSGTFHLTGMQNYNVK